MEHDEGDAEAVWRGAGSGAELLARRCGLLGFGERKARICGALLAKRLLAKRRGVRPP